jgi:hypothetical protein
MVPFRYCLRASPPTSPEQISLSFYWIGKSRQISTLYPTSDGAVYHIAIIEARRRGMQEAKERRRMEAYAGVRETR